MARKQPSTIDTQRVAKRDQRQESKNKAASSKSGAQKFNTGINLEAVFGAISQLLETFTNQVLDSNSVNMSLLLRTIYRNLSDDLVGILSEQQNVDYLNKQLADKNKEVAKALAGNQTIVEKPTKQEQPAASEHLTTTVTDTVVVKDKVIEKAPEVNVVPPKIIVKTVETERKETLPDILEEEKVVERTETLPEEVVESKTETTEVRTVKTPNVSRTQRAFAAGEITSDEDVDILQLAQDFITELESDAWRLNTASGVLAQELTDKYDEFVDRIDEDDEDEYEWNLYRFMFRKQQELNEARKARMAGLLAKRVKAVQVPKQAEEPKEKESAKAEEREEPSGVEPKETEQPAVEPTEEKTAVVEKEMETVAEVGKKPEQTEKAETAEKPAETKSEAEPAKEKKPTETKSEQTEPPKEEKKEEKKEDKKPKKGIFQALMDRFKASVKRRKDALMKKIMPFEESEEGESEEGEETDEMKKGGLLSAIMRPFQERRERNVLAKELFVAASDKKSQVLLAPVPLRRTIVSRLKNGKQLLKLWGRRNVLLMQTSKPDEKGETKKQGFWASLFKRKAQATKTTQKKQEQTAPKPTMVGRGVLRAANTVNTVKNVFFKPTVHHIAVMNNAIVYPLWIKKVKDRSRKVGLLGKMKHALFGDPAIKWKPLALGWRRFSKAQDQSMRELLANRNAWRRISYRWQKLYFKLLKQFQKERNARGKAVAGRKDKVSKLVSRASKALAATNKVDAKTQILPDTIAAMDKRMKEEKGGRKEKAESKTEVKPPKEVPVKKELEPVARVAEIASSLGSSKPTEKGHKGPTDEPAPSKSDGKFVSVPLTSENKEQTEQKAEEPQKPRPNAFIRMTKSVLRRATSVFASPQTKGTSEPTPPATPATPPPPTPSPKVVPPIVGKAAPAEKPSQPQSAPAINPTLNTPKPSVQPAAEKKPSIKSRIKKFGRGMVSIPGKMIDTARSLRKRQQQDQKQADAEQAGAQKEKPKSRFGLGLLNRRKKVGDDEAFRRNVSEESSKVHAAFDDKSINRLGFPHKRIANALKRFFDNTSKISKKANEDLNDVEDQINNPRRGLWPTIKAFLFKVVIGGLLAIGILTWFRKNVTDWLPKDKAGKMFHGPSIFGIQLPNFKDIFHMGRSLFYMVWSPLKGFIRIVKRGVKSFMKSNDIKTAGGFVRYIKNFVFGFIMGKIMAGVDGAMGGIASTSGGITKAAGMLPSFLSKLQGPLMKIAEAVPIVGTIKMAIRLASMVGGALWCLISDIFGKSNKASDELVEDAAKYGEAKVMELVGENRHGKAAGNVLIHKAKQIKPLAPVKNLLPDSMKAKDAKGNLQLKGLVPNLPKMNLGRGTITDEMDDINQVADKRKENEEKEAQNSGVNEINKAMAGMPEVSTGDDSPFADNAGDKSARTKAAEKFIVLANKNIEVLQKAHDSVGDDFDGPYWSINWLYKKGKDKNIAWNPEYQYTGANAKMLKTKMPLTPFEDNSDGSKEYDLAEPWNHEIMGVLPLGVRIKKTNAAYIVDVPSWQKWRYSVGIRNWTRIRDWVADHPEDFGSEAFQKRVGDQAQDWVDYTLEPGVWARIRDGRKSGMVDRWNEWNEEHGKVKEKVAEIREGLQKPTPKPKQDNGSEKGKEKPKKSLWSRFWSSKTMNLVKKVAKYGTGIGWAYMAGKKVWSLFSKKELDDAKKKPPPPPKPPIQVGKIYISRLTWSKPWRILMRKDAKPKEFRDLFGIDKWFDKEPPSDEKIYKTGIGKMFYNILLAMGFKYDKAVWQNIKFLQVRGKSMKAMVDSITGYMNNIIRPYGEYMYELFQWSKSHKTEEEQQAVKKAAEKLHREMISGNAVNKAKFMEYVAKFYMPTDIHLVVRNKEGKIIKEEGKELRGFQVPKELYDRDPKYWDEVMTLLNESALPPESLLKLHETRIALIGHIEASTKKVSKYLKALRIKRIRLNFANKLADRMLAFRMRLLTRTVANIRFRIGLAKKEIRLYFKYRKFLNTGSLGAFRSFIFGGNKLSKKEQIELFGRQLKGGKSSLSQRMLGSVSEVIADRRKLIRRMRSIIRRLLKRGDNALRRNTLFGFRLVKAVVKKARKRIKSLATGAKKIFKAMTIGRIKLGLKVASRIKKATSINLGLFKLFQKKKADDAEIKMKADITAKEMVPKDDKDGNERLQRILKLAQERKEASEKEKTGLMNYWADLKRKWKDRISEESMHELKVASTRLSDNIMDYVGMVREIPAGRTTLVNTTIHELPSVIELLPDIVFSS